VTTDLLKPDDAEKLIARFRDQPSKKAGFAARTGIPTAAYEMVAAKDIFLMMAPPGMGGVNQRPGVTGPEGVTVNVCACPPGNGPLMHIHQKTGETFMCLQGRFELRMGRTPQGEVVTHLDPFDLVPMPPGLWRQFRNVTEDTAYLLVITAGDRASFGDIHYTPQVGREIAERFGNGVREAFVSKLGFHFEVPAA
jgi:mannose-6-phosphate isomerase-like protein (cupin superfamily)